MNVPIKLIDLKFIKWLMLKKIPFRIFQCRQWTEAAHPPWAGHANPWTGWDRWALTTTWTVTTRCTSTGAEDRPLRVWCPTGWEVTPWALLMEWWAEECLPTPSHLAPVAAVAEIVLWVPARWRHHIRRPAVTQPRPRRVRRWRRCRQCRRHRDRYRRWSRERRTSGRRRTFVKCTIWFVKEVKRKQ